MELRLKERVRADHVKKGERYCRQVDQKKSKLVGVVQQCDELGGAVIEGRKEVQAKR